MDDIVNNLREDFDACRKDEYPQEVISDYENERHEAAKEIELLRKAVVKYADAARMGNVEPSELQQAIDRAFQFQPS